MRNRLAPYGGRMIETDGRPAVELCDFNDNARRRFQYRRTADGDGLERRILRRDGTAYPETGSPWEPYTAVELRELLAVRGHWHPILDPLGFGLAAPLEER